MNISKNMKSLGLNYHRFYAVMPKKTHRTGLRGRRSVGMGTHEGKKHGDREYVRDIFNVNALCCSDISREYTQAVKHTKEQPQSVRLFVWTLAWKSKCNKCNENEEEEKCH